MMARRHFWVQNLCIQHYQLVGWLILFLTPSLGLCAPSGARQAHSYRGTSQLRRTTYDLKNSCGIPGVRSEENKVIFKVLNGTCAPYGAHPWMAQIQVRFGSKYRHHCGGTILTEDIVLTAAHCMNRHSSNMRVVVGQGSLSTEDEMEVAFDIEDYINHPRWDSPVDGRWSNDLALIKIRRKGDGRGIQFSNQVAPACLPAYDSPQKSGTDCVVSGWGKTNAESTQDTDCLQSINVPLIEKSECQAMYSGNSDRKIIDTMMCAGYARGGTDACEGDSGGPLTCKQDGRFYIHGIVSWGEGCGQPNLPGVYTNVKNYLQWIEEMISSF